MLGVKGRFLIQSELLRGCRKNRRFLQRVGVRQFKFLEEKRERMRGLPRPQEGPQHTELLRTLWRAILWRFSCPATELSARMTWVDFVDSNHRLRAIKQVTGR